MRKKIKGDTNAYGLVLVQIFSKLAGISRELLVANFFGPSVVFAEYLKLMTYGSLVGVFCSEGGLSANLMRKFSLMHRKGYSFNGVKKSSIIISLFVFFVVFLVQLIALKYLIKIDYNFYYIIIVNSIASALVFYFNVGQIVLVANSDYKNMYKSNFYRSFVYLVILYPLVSLFSVFGLALNRLISVFTQYFNTWKVVDRKYLKKRKTKLNLGARDFNIWIFLTNNSIFLWFILAKMYFTFFTGIDIIFIVYAYQLASSFDGVIIKSFSLYLLERSNNTDFKITKTIITVVSLSLVGIVFSYFFAEKIIELIFSLGNTFSKEHYKSIYNYFMLLLVLVCFNGVTNILFQKVFSKRRDIQFKLSKIYIAICLFAYLLVSLYSYSKGYRYEFIYLMVASLSLINTIFVVYILKNERII